MHFIEEKNYNALEAIFNAELAKLGKCAVTSKKILLAEDSSASSDIPKQRSGTYGSRVISGSFQDCTWLSGLQTYLSRPSSKYCKTANTSIKAFQGYH